MRIITWLSKILFGDEEVKKCDNIMLKSRDLGDGKYEVSGIIFYADSHIEAIRKYRTASDE